MTTLATMIQQILLQYRYLGIFFMLIVEGLFTTIFTWYGIFAGYFRFLPAFITVLLGDVASDLVYYHLGFFANKSKRIQRYIAKKKFLFENLALLETLWEKHPMKTMFFGKQAYLICGPIIISSGVLRIKLSRFLRYTIPVSAFQALLLLGIGYYFGNGYVLASQYMQYPAILLAIILVGFWFAYRRMGIYFSGKFRQK